MAPRRRNRGNDEAEEEREQQQQNEAIDFEQNNRETEAARSDGSSRSSRRRTAERAQRRAQRTERGRRREADHSDTSRRSRRNESTRDIMPRRPNPLWAEHTNVLRVVNTSGQAGSGTRTWVCKYCGEQMTSTITRVLKHLTGIGTTGHCGGCEAVPPALRDALILEHFPPGSTASSQSGGAHAAAIAAEDALQDALLGDIGGSASALPSFAGTSRKRARVSQVEDEGASASAASTGGISTISFGANLTLEESEQLQKRRPGYDSKRREMLGSRIFDQDLISEPAPAHVPEKTLPAGLVTPTRSGSQNSPITEESAISPKRSASLSEMAKQRELTGSFFGAGRDTPTSRRPTSSAKSKELEGSNIFGRSSQEQFNTATSNDLNKYQEQNAPPRTSVKVSNPAGGRSQIVFGCDGGQQFGMHGKKQEPHRQKAAELSGHDIFKEEASKAVITSSNNQSERIVSAAKKKEMLGNNIFSDSNSIIECNPRRARQPPGGESNLKLY
ncbi:hypothetical protein L7F22_030805 [Adiantum nelumboides]|nr:hypothetical protein [Adiantum nelumboides]